MRVPDAASSAKGKTADPGASSGSSAATEVEAVEKFTLDELKGAARRLFGVSKHAVAGALALEKKAQWTIEEAKRRIEAFLNEEVPPSQHSQTQGRRA